MTGPDDRDDLGHELADIIDAYDRVRTHGGDDAELCRRRDDLIGRLARRDAEVP